MLEEQRHLSAADLFSRAHDSHGVHAPGEEPGGGARYRELMPASAPGPGQQYAFEVMLDQCSGCKACVTACHSLNGLEPTETWREVGVLISNDRQHPFQQTVTTACHHCVDPACLNGCPVLAYEKQESTGIVRHLDDQCIGCQYCVMMCPYEVPRYSEARGIVRKCDLCSQRLSVNEPPACAQACPNDAIRIRVIETAPLITALRPRSASGSSASLDLNSPAPWLPAAPDAAITVPTTRYVSRRPLAADLVPGDASEGRLQPAHWPLVWMLTLTQFSVGLFLFAPTLPAAAHRSLAWTAWVTVALGILASILHLGQPMKAWRAFLGLRRSWLSREIVTFGIFLPLAARSLIQVEATRGAGLPAAWTCLVALVGLIGVGCSGMIYHETRRAFWRGPRSMGRFLLTTTVLGTAGAWSLLAFTGGSARAGLPWILIALTTWKLALDLRLLRLADTAEAELTWPRPEQADSWSLTQTACRLRGTLGPAQRARFACAWVGGILLPGLALLGAKPGAAFGASEVTLPLAAMTLCLAGEILERWLFFRAVVPARMPGGLGNTRGDR